MILTERLHDTLVVVERDESMIRALLECDSLGQVRLKELTEYRAGSRLRPPMIHLSGNILTAEAVSDSIAIYLLLKDRYEQRITRSEGIVLQTVEVNRLNGWQKLWIRTGQALIILLLLYGFLKIRKFINL